MADPEEREAIAVEKRRMRARWAEEGYDPRAHLRAVTAEGDVAVMHAIFAAHRDRAVRAGGHIVCRLACEDMIDIARAIMRRAREAELAQIVAGSPR